MKKLVDYRFTDAIEKVPEEVWKIADKKKALAAPFGERNVPLYPREI